MKQTKDGMKYEEIFMYEQKDIILIPFPYSDLSGSKQRPALIISNKKINKTQDRICCLITSNEPKEGILIENKYFDNGHLPFKSWVKPQRIFTIEKSIIKKKLCTLNKKFHDNIIENINEIIK
jgi:mRNA interferase MazF